MVVSDVITGFEIKSDRDNYQRLEEQVRTYDRFFDRNYLVVGHTHAASAAARVPQHWGILCIEKDRVTVLRTAKENKAVSRRSQLSVLWKLELKNILLKNEMPLFAQKEKGYIADRIAEQVEDAVLQKQIAYELLHRDYSTFPSFEPVITIGSGTYCKRRNSASQKSQWSFSRPWTTRRRAA